MASPWMARECEDIRKQTDRMNTLISEFLDTEPLHPIMRVREGKKPIRRSSHAMMQASPSTGSVVLQPGSASKATPDSMKGSKDKAAATKAAATSSTQPSGLVELMVRKFSREELKEAEEAGVEEIAEDEVRPDLSLGKMIKDVLVPSRGRSRAASSKPSSRTQSA